MVLDTELNEMNRQAITCERSERDIIRDENVSRMCANKKENGMQFQIYVITAQLHLDTCGVCVWCAYA